MKKFITLMFSGLFFCFATNPATAAEPTQPLIGNAQAGQHKVSMCMGCHAISGYKASYPEVYHAPMLGGQSEKYLISALGDYKKGTRNHPTMRGNAGSLSEQDILDIAAYYAPKHLATHGETMSSLADKLTHIEPNSARERRGQQIVNKLACASCHGADFQTPIDPSYPKLAGQPADYLQHALIAYKRTPQQMNARNNAIMAVEANKLSDEEIKDVAAFLHRLPTSLVMEP